MQAAFVLTLGAVALRIYYVQSAFGPKLLSEANQVQNTTQVVLAQRGALLDRNGHPLAYDVPAFMMDIKTDAFPDLQLLATQLSPILGDSADHIAQQLQSGKHWVRWPSPVLEPDKEKISVSSRIRPSSVPTTPPM